jgi:ABC-type branched-subunit amino acid transport system substrate-binding protein
MMKKLVVFMVLTTVGFSALTAQNANPKRILLLIPFHSEETGEINMPINSDQDIYAILPFALAGFWEGAQLALDRLEREKAPLNIIVRDISNDKEKLIRLLSDEKMMQEVSLIIGPFYAEMFLLAAQYAKKYEIPIINPFSSRQDILIDNPYVYKLSPSDEAYCQDLYDRFGRDTNRYRIILWGNNDNPSYKQAAYQDFFKQHNIPVRNVEISTDVCARFAPNKENVVVVFTLSTPIVLNTIRKLSAKKMEKNILVIPEEWLELKEIMPDYLNTLNVHFYSNHFIDYQNDKTQLFISDYIERFNSIPALARFSFQGYDIINYFIRSLCLNQDAATIALLASKFDFMQHAGDGHENRAVRFCEIRDFSVVEVEKLSTTILENEQWNQLKTGKH